jgi:subtilase family serine protease
MRAVMRKTCMVSFPKCVAILVLLLAVPVISSAQTAAKNRIVQAIDDTQRTVVQGNLHPMARPEFDQGRADGSMPINHASIVFKPSPSQQRALDALLAAQQDPSSPSYHQWLTPEQYADRFGMTPSDIAKVVSWLQSKGLTVSTARSRNEVFFGGTVAQIESAFDTEIHHYLVNGEQHFANAIEPSVPSAFAHTVLGVHNLNDFRPKPRARGAAPHFTSSISGNHFLTPNDFATIYDLGPLYALGFDGTDQKIAVVGDSAITLSNIDTFRSLSGLSKNDPQTVIVPNTGTPTHNSDEVEADLDLEWSGGVAKNATIIYVVVGPAAAGGAFDAVTFAIQNNVAPVISSSFGLCEADETKAGALSIQLLARQANAQGQTITVATGDAGAADCDGDLPVTPSVASLGLAVDVPASIPEVTGVGGSEFGTTSTPDPAGVVTGTPPNTNAGPTPFWNGTINSTDTIGSALSYIPEMAWNDSPQTGTGPVLDTVLSAGGGGVSTIFLKPSWQTGTGVPNDGHRDVPDIALSASPNHDGYLICSPPAKSGNPQPCTTGFRDSKGRLDVVGGTSTGAPTFAGIVAIINQATNSNGQGNINPTLYSLFNTPPALPPFHDVTTGSNQVPCKSGSPNCPSTPPSGCTVPCIGYPATAGYDLASGLGSVNATNLVNAWPKVTTPHYAILPPNPTTIAISAPGGSGTSSISVTAQNGFTGTVNLSCALTPASSTAQITCSMNPPSVALSSTTTTGSSTLTVSTMAPHAMSSISASARLHGRLGWFAASGGALLVGILVVGVSSRRRRWGAVLGLLLFAFLAAGMGCGGGSSTPPPVTNPGTPAGSYIITVTTSSGATSLPDLVTVNVQ